MSSETVLSKLDALNIWKQGDQRAPHKPLLDLYHGRSIAEVERRGDFIR